MTVDECRKKIADAFGFHATPYRMAIVEDAINELMVSSPVPIVRIKNNNEDKEKDDEVTLLDEFAICALQGMYASGDVVFGDSEDHESTAREAYDIAEIMLAERKSRWV